MRRCEFAIATDVCGHDHFTSWRLSANHFAGVGKGLNDLHSKINDDGCFARRWMMVEEAFGSVVLRDFLE